MLAPTFPVTSPLTSPVATRRLGAPLPGAGLLLQANCGLTLAASSGKQVSAWADLSGNGLNASQATSGLQPLFENPGTQGLAGIDFDGSDDALTVAANAAINDLWDGGGYYIFAGRKDGNGGGGFGSPVAKENAGLTTGWILYTSGGSNIGFQVQFSTTDGLWTIPFSLTTPFVLEVEYNSGATTNDPTITVNGVAATVTEAATPVGTRVSDASDALTIGCRPGLTRAWDGPHFAHGFSTTIPSTAEKAEIRRYFGRLAGLSL